MGLHRVRHDSRDLAAASLYTERYIEASKLNKLIKIIQLVTRRVRI